MAYRNNYRNHSFADVFGQLAVGGELVNDRLQSHQVADEFAFAGGDAHQPRHGNEHFAHYVLHNVENIKNIKKN